MVRRCPRQAGWASTDIQRPRRVPQWREAQTTWSTRNHPKNRVAAMDPGQRPGPAQPSCSQLTTAEISLIPGCQLKPGVINPAYHSFTVSRALDAASCGSTLPPQAPGHLPTSEATGDQSDTRIAAKWTMGVKRGLLRTSRVPENLRYAPGRSSAAGSGTGTIASARSDAAPAGC